MDSLKIICYLLIFAAILAFCKYFYRRQAKLSSSINNNRKWFENILSEYERQALAYLIEKEHRKVDFKEDTIDDLRKQYGKVFSRPVLLFSDEVKKRNMSYGELEEIEIEWLRNNQAINEPTIGTSPIKLVRQIENILIERNREVAHKIILDRHSQKENGVTENVIK